jgi:hypothetical protein
MKNLIISATILLLVCCDDAEATSKDNNIVNQVITPTTIKKPVVLDLDDMRFDDAFAIQHRAKGEGHTFWWNGEQYTTDLAVLDEFVLKHASSNEAHQGWVTNNDDPDDNCKSNKLDDCGVCDGPGKMTWWRDKDGDGLGTFMEWITSCTYPTDMEIENYQAESLQEGGGDQGK